MQRREHLLEVIRTALKGVAIGVGTDWVRGIPSEGGDELRRYTELTGRPVDAAAFGFYRLRWALDDISCFVRNLRAPHRRTPGAEHAWRALELSVAQLAE